MPAVSMPLRLAVTTALVSCLVLQLLFSARSLLAAFYATRGGAVQLTGDHAGARRDFHRANQAVPFEADRFRLEAAAARESLGPQAAAPLYARSLRLAPFAPLVLLAAAENLMAFDQTDAAEEILNRAATVIPDDWRVRYMHGLILMKRERYAEAAGEFRSASKIAFPFVPDTSYQLAQALHATGDEAKALQEVEKSIRTQPLAPEFRLVRGKILFAQNQVSAAGEDFAWAAQEFQRRAERDTNALPRLREAQDLLAQAYLAEGHFDQAQRVLEKLYTRCSPEQIDQLAGRLAQLLSAPPTPTPPLAFWAFSLDLFVQTRRLADFDRALELAPSLHPESDLGELIPARARALTAAGKPEDAIALLGAAPAGVVDSPPYRLALAEAKAAAGRPAEARTGYAKLLSLPELSPAIRKQAHAALAAILPQ
jgi:tetratricopeptide (TPR) repeat protein